MRRALLADDEPVTRRVVAAMLQRQGFDVTEVENGLEAVAMLAQHTFDVVMTDRNMPEMGGVALTRHIQGIGDGAVPVIMMTSSSTEAAASEAMESGARALLTKPVGARELSAVLDELLKR